MSQTDYSFVLSSSSSSLVYLKDIDIMSNRETFLIKTLDQPLQYHWVISNTWTLLGVQLYKKHGGGSMRVTILPYAVILTKAWRVAVSMMAKGRIVAQVLPLRCFLFLLSYYIHVNAIMIQHFYVLTRGKY